MILFGFIANFPQKKNTRGQEITVEITLETVEIDREKTHGIDNRAPGILTRARIFHRRTVRRKKNILVSVRLG